MGSIPNETRTLTFGDDTPETREKLGELMLYLASKCATHRRFGRTKLNKILYFADFVSFKTTGRSITGAQYQRIDHGPAPRHLVPVRTQLIDDGHAVETVACVIPGREQKRLVAKRRANLSKFTAAEIALVDEVVEALRRASADTVSKITHGVAWHLAANGDGIPYDAIFLSDRRPTRADEEWAAGVLARRQRAAA